MHQLCFHLSPRRRRETISFPFENCFSKFSPIRDCYPLSTPYWFLCLLPVSFHPAGGGAKTCRAPFGLLWVADKTNPAVHAFDMSVLAALHAEWLAPMMGIAWVTTCIEIFLISKKVWADSKRHRWCGFRSCFVIADRRSVYLCGVVVKVALDVAWLCSQLNLSASNSSP